MISALVVMYCEIKPDRRSLYTVFVNMAVRIVETFCCYEIITKGILVFLVLTKSNLYTC